MTGRYKRYVYDDGEKMSRSTEYRRRKKAQVALEEKMQVVSKEMQTGVEASPDSGPENTLRDTSLEVRAVEKCHSTTNRETSSLTTALQEPDSNFLEMSNLSVNPPDVDCPQEYCNASMNVEEPHYTVETERASDTENIVNETINNSYDPKMLKKVCRCASATVGDVVAMCLALGLRHNLTWQAQVDILKMVNSIYPQDKIPASKYTYLKQLNDKSNAINHHVYCNRCEAYIGERTGLKGCMLCNVCKTDVDVSDPSNYFIALSLESQFINILEDASVANTLLTYRFHREKDNENALEDMYDGQEYKKLCRNGGVLASKYNFSYTFFTDGCPFGKSSNKTIWPIYVSINELPPKERGHYICLAGLYVGPKDPNLNVYMQPFVDQANNLSSNGFTWKHNGEDVVSKVIPLCAVADSVARWSMLHRQSFHAFYGCTFCYHKATHTKKGLRYVFAADAPPAEDRTLQSLDQDLAKAYERRNNPDPRLRPYRGVKGPSPLMSLHYFNIISGVVVDYMHNILLGVTRLHMDLLFDASRKKYWAGMAEDRVGLAHLESAIDERLLKIRPPTFITRTPRSIKNRKLWKASEWLNWLLFYSLPCCTGLLDSKFLIHIAMLSKATHILLQKSITSQCLNEAQELIFAYQFLFQKYFGESEMVYNVHLLSHITSGVVNWGPLWTHNAFVFEGQNRFLLQLCKSPHLLALQVARKFLIYNSFPSTSARLLSSVKPADFCANLLHKKVKFFARSSDALLLGRGKLCDDLSYEEAESLSGLNVSYSNCVMYSRMIYKGVRYVVENYRSKKMKQDDACIFTKDGDMVIIQNIFHVSNSKVVLSVRGVLMEEAIIDTHHPLRTGKSFVCSHIRKGTENGALKCITPDCIRGPCIFMNLPVGQFGSVVPFGCYAD